MALVWHAVRAGVGAAEVFRFSRWSMFSSPVGPVGGVGAVAWVPCVGSGLDFCEPMFEQAIINGCSSESGGPMFGEHAYDIVGVCVYVALVILHGSNATGVARVQAL